MFGTMDTKSSGESDRLVDLEIGGNAAIDGPEGVREESGSSNGDLNRVWSGFVGIDGLVKGEGTGTGKLGRSMSGNVLGLPVINVEASPDKKSGEKEGASLLEKKPGAERPKKKSCKKPPRPPRSSMPLDAAYQKLIKELSELVMLKRARIERMKKKLKSTKSPSSNGNFGNLLAWIITVLFCLVVLWEGFSPQGASSVGSHGSPESSTQRRDGLITIQFYNNTSRYAPQSSHSASPSNVEPTSLLDSMHERKLGRRIRKH